MELFISAGIFVAVFALTLSVGRRPVRPVARLAQHQIVAGGVAAPAPRQRFSLLGGRAQRMGFLGGRLARPEARSKAEKLLREADSSMSLARYFMLRSLFMFGIGPMVALMALASQGMTVRGIGSAAVALLILANAPKLRLRRKARKRARRIEIAMPDALDLLVVCVEGGLSLDGGLQQVARRTSGELAGELRRLLTEIGAGVSRRDAFVALAGRSQSQSLGIFCATMVQADKMGMSVAATLRTLVETMRTRRRQAAETQARKAPVKMLPILVVFMIPSLFIVILGPAMVSIIDFFSSQSG